MVCNPVPAGVCCLVCFAAVVDFVFTPKVVLVARHGQGRGAPFGFRLIFCAKKSPKNLVHWPRAGRTVGLGMKTKPTTAAAHSRKESAANEATKSHNEQPGKLPGMKLKPPVGYPDLEEEVPDGCFTTQDLPE
ncbi:MAG: hypothetical protein AAGB22_05470 [Bacteroidota bacterium]